MRLHFESSMMVPGVSDVIALLTDKAQIDLSDIQYREDQGVVVIRMRRKQLLEVKKTFLGLMKPVYGNRIVDVTLTIRDVTGLDIQADESLVKECDSRFTALFGVKVDNNKFYIGSIEEGSGRTLCHVNLTVKKLNVEFVDEGNGS